MMVSVIIPIYNSSDYLRKCLDSLKCQTYKEFEAILVDDGSTDGSSDICQEYCQDSEQFIYIRQENGGVSSARNAGLKAASGSYVVFLDSDDKIHENYLSYLVEHTAGQDLAVCGYFKVETAEVHNENEQMEEQVQMRISASEFMDAMFGVSSFGYQGYLWNKIFRKDILEDNRIMFDEQIRYNEDRLFVVTYLQYCNTVSYGNVPLYYYYQRESSAMGKLAGGYKHTMITEIQAFEQMIPIVQKKYQSAYTRALYDAFYAVERMSAIADETEDQAYLNRMYHQISHQLLKDKNTSLKRKIKVLLKLKLGGAGK